MTVFKTFLKVVNKYKFIVILYTVILIIFAGFNMKTSDNSTNFIASKPDVLIINNDKGEKLSQNLINYIEKNSSIINIQDTEEARNDALFYRDVNYIIYIPENYSNNFIKGLNPEIEIKSTGDYQSSYAEMMLTRYIKVANIYVQDTKNQEELLIKINETLSKETEIQVTSKLDTDNLAKATFYYNFLNYSILAGCVYVICMIMSSFNEEKIKKRTIISSMSYKKYNKQLILANGILTIILWAFYVILSFILVRKIMFSINGIILIINSFIFSICCLSTAFLIAILVNNKNAINGIINVVALGTSFLCGAFVPVEWLPDSILKIAHILPSYWYIQNNEIVKTLETINFESLKPILINMLVIIVFTMIQMGQVNFVSRKRRNMS